MAETVGNIQVVATINTKGYDDGKKKIENSNKELEKSSKDTSDNFSNSFSKIGNVASVAGKAIAVGLATATASIVALGTKSISAFSDYEQLTGGVAKIFDQMDNTKILADADAAYANLNLSANQYLETINSLGASFASNMGDKAGYETAQKGMQAIADFASGTGRNVDELNEKYQLITRSAATYQSIADQFSGILPATSADFLKQAQSAGFLSTKYTELTQVPIAEYQTAVTDMLQKGVGALGLTGNTAAETANTISGSFNATKASWDNLLSSLAGGDDKRFENSLNNLITSAGNFSGNILKLLPTLVNSLSKLGSELITGLPKVLKTLLPVLIDTTVNLFTQMVTMLPTLIPILVDGIVQLFTGMINSLPVILPALINGILSLFTSMINALPKIQPMLIDGVIMLFNAVITLITSPGVLSQLLIASLQMFMGIVQALPQIIDALIQALPMLIAALVSFLTDPSVIMQLVKATVILFGALITAVPLIFGSLMKAFGTLLTSLWAGLQDNFTRFGANFGNSIGGAIKSGINGVLGWIESTVNNIINNINSMMKSIDDVIPGDQSGARVPRLSIPRLANGGMVSSNMPYIVGDNPDGSLNSTSELFIPRTSGTIVSSRDLQNMIGGGGTTNTFNINLSGIMASSPSDERAIAKRLAERINEELRSKGKQELAI